MTGDSKSPVGPRKDICDFCSSPEVVKRFECRDFDSPSEDAGVIYPDTKDTDGPTNLIFASNDYWAACADCAALVEAADIDGLIRWAMDGYEERVGRSHSRRAMLEKHLRQTYRLFFQNTIRKA